MPDDAGWGSAGFAITGGSSSSPQTNTSNADDVEEETKGDPYTNEYGIPTVKGGVEEDMEVNRGFDADQLFSLIKKSPEALSIMQAIVDDVIGSDFTFEYLGESSGERRTKDAKKFWNSGAKEQAADALLDMLIMGDGYMYKRKLTETEIKSKIKDHLEETKSFNFSSSYDVAANEVTEELKSQYTNRDEGMFSTRGLQMVPASTVEHQINEHGDIINYHQEAGGNDTDIDPDKMVHIDYMRLNGKSYGFTPARSILSELTMLANAKDHNGTIFENAGIVNKVFKLPNEGPNSANYKLLKRTIKKFRKLENKHQDMVLTGDIEIEDLNNVGDQMDFRELAIYITRVIVMAWGVPPTRIGMPIGGDGAARTTSLTHEGYFKRINRIQDSLETVLNSELFVPEFNCRIKLETADIKAEIRRAERDMRKLEVVQKAMALGRMNPDAANDYLDIPEHETMDLDNEEHQQMMEIASDLQSSKNNLLDDEFVENDRAQDEINKDKERTSNSENGNES